MKSFLSQLLRNLKSRINIKTMVNSRKAALFAFWNFFWLASLVLYIYNWEDLKLYSESGSSSEVFWIFGNILYISGLIDPVILGSWLSSWLDGSTRLPTAVLLCCFCQAGFVCISAINLIIRICTVGSVKIGIWLTIVSNLIKFILLLFLINQTYALRPTQVPQLSQPNLLANQRPTSLTPNFEDVEQPPPSYEEYLAQRNDMPPKYEDLEEAPPAYQETMV